jgi:hypothetical protein
MEKIIKISAVFKIVEDDEEVFLENTMTIDTEKASKKSMTKLELYSFLKELTINQIENVSKNAKVLDASVEEVKEHYEQK